MKKHFYVACLIFFIQIPLANATIINFDDLTSPNEQDLASYSAEGYNITSSVNAANAFLSWGSTNTYYSGSATLASAYMNATITLKREDNNPFNFTSIDVESLYTRLDGTPEFIAPAEITFTGVTSNNNLVTQTISISPTPFVSALSTFAISGFEDVKTVYWAQGGVNNSDLQQRHQFDNIIVSSNPVSAVPEPATLWLFATGIPCLIGFRRRSNV